MTGPTREVVAALVRFAADAVRPRDLQQFFVCMVTLLDLEPTEISAFGSECGLDVGVIRLTPAGPEKV